MAFDHKIDIFDIDQAPINFRGNLVDIPQFSTTSVEDYSLVSRKHLQKIVNNSERCLTDDEHRWLIKRDCKRVISELTKLTRRRKSKKNLQEERKDGYNVKMPTLCTIDQYILNNSMFRCNTTHNVLAINSGNTAVDDKNRFNVIVENNLTIINIQHLNINIQNNNNNEYNIRQFGYDSVCKEEENSSSEVMIMDLERIYWDKWRNYVKKKVSFRTNRLEKIDSFLLKIQEKLNVDKHKCSKMQKSSKSVVSKEVKTVYDRQNDKIKNQKKLLEIQKKEIDRLKLQQLKLETEKAMLENQKMLDQTYDKSEKRLKIKNGPPAKCSIIKVSKSDILNRMEIRALDRQVKWEAIKERHRKMEQEKLRKKQELEEKCLKEQMEHKRKQLFEARENLKLKRIEECKQKMERDILIQNIKIADDFHQRLLIKNGFRAFVQNLKNGKLLMEMASNYYEKKILGSCFCKWRFFANNNLNEKIFLAEQFYKHKLIQTTFLSFLKILEENKKKQQVAEDWHNYKIQEFWFEQWLNYIRQIGFQTQKKMLEAESYHNKIIMKCCFKSWRMFPEIVYKERLKDCRLRMWHEKVQEILPDFIPPELE